MLRQGRGESVSVGSGSWLQSNAIDNRSRRAGMHTRTEDFAGRRGQAPRPTRPRRLPSGDMTDDTDDTATAPFALSGRRQLAVTWGIPDEYGGMTAALLHRSRAFARAGA